VDWLIYIIFCFKKRNNSCSNKCKLGLKGRNGRLDYSRQPLLLLLFTVHNWPRGVDLYTWATARGDLHTWATAKGDPQGVTYIHGRPQGSPLLCLYHLFRGTVRRCFQLVIHHTYRVQQRFVDRDGVVPFCKRTFLVVHYPTSLVEDRQSNWN